MNADLSRNERRLDPDVKAGIVKRAAQVLFQVAVQAAVLFLSAGRLNWLNAWVYIGLYVVWLPINFVFMMRLNPDVIAERAKSRGMRDWDKLVAGLGAAMYLLGIQITAGLDERFGWTEQMALAVQSAGAVAVVLGGVLFSWAMITNAYFATVVRIQQERGHAVCNTGPYQFVRHPGYVGVIIQSLAVPLMLGSLWALIPGGLAVLLMIVRTALEDRTLQDELDGYRDYTKQVRYRLLPGVW